MQKGSLSEPSGAVGRWDHEFRLRNRWCGSEVAAAALGYGKTTWDTQCVPLAMFGPFGGGQHFYRYDSGYHMIDSEVLR